MPDRVRTLALAAALVLLVVPATAQTGAVLSGVVHDGTGHPVPGVVLTLVDVTTQETRVAVTDQQGRYFVDRLGYGAAYSIDVSHPRFRASRVLASANEGETPVDIALDRRRSRLARLGSFCWRVLRLGFMAGPAAI